MYEPSNGWSAVSARTFAMNSKGQSPFDGHRAETTSCCTALHVGGHVADPAAAALAPDMATAPMLMSLSDAATSRGGASLNNAGWMTPTSTVCHSFPVNLQNNDIAWPLISVLSLRMAHAMNQKKTHREDTTTIPSSWRSCVWTTWVRCRAYGGSSNRSAADCAISSGKTASGGVAQAACMQMNDQPRQGSL